jgi:ankyrin repeat protein
VIEALLTHQKDIILDQDEDGNTPLHLAALNGFKRCVKLLLMANADLDARYV